MRFESVELRDGNMQSADGRDEFTRRVLPIVKGATAINHIGGPRICRRSSAPEVQLLPPHLYDEWVQQRLVSW